MRVWLFFPYECDLPLLAGMRSSRKAAIRGATIHAKLGTDMVIIPATLDESRVDHLLAKRRKRGRKAKKR